MTSDGSRARLFFAAWPDPEIQAALHGAAQRFQRECGGRPTARGKIHLTLAFLGDLERERLPQCEAIAAAVAAARCELMVDRVEYVRRNRILWAAVERCPDPLRALVGGLAAGLAAAGFRTEDRPFVPHVTLLREARRAPADALLPAIAWPVPDFALVESVQRGRERVYEVLRRWPLAW